MIIVTGATGFIGSNLLAELELRQYKGLVAVDSFGVEDKWRNISKRIFPYLVSPQDIDSFIESNVQKIKAIIHLGGISSTTENNVDSEVELSESVMNKFRNENTTFVLKTIHIIKPLIAEYKMIVENKKRKIWYISIVVIISFTLILYLIEFLTVKPVFDITKFSLNYVISLPFMLLSLIMNSCVGVIISRTISRKQPVFVRIVVNGVLAVLIAVMLVIIGNLPFISDMAGFVKTIAFWKSVAAMTLLNVILIAAVDYMMQMVANRNLQKENAILQYRQLKSQINPHFLFNSLNVLVSTINKDRDAAVEYTKKLSAVYRYVLTQDLQDTVTLKEEIDFIDNYIGILRVRFDKGLEFRFDINPDDMPKSIPPMSLQLLIENAVKHNAVLPDDPLVINILTEHSFLIVSNNLKPRVSCNPGIGIGLKNLSKKYEIIAGTDISVLKDSNTFTVKLPLL